MVVVAHVAAVRIMLYANEQPPPHVHAKFAEHQAVIDIASLTVVEGFLPIAKRRAVPRLGGHTTGATHRRVHASDGPRESGAHRMKRLPRVRSAKPVIHGVLKLVFLDGYEGVIDLRPLVARGRVFARLQGPKHFAAVHIEAYGHSIGWVDDTGYEIDLGADSLPRDCERQAEIHKLMVV